MTTFNEFLNTECEDFKVVFNFYLDFLGELSSKKFPFEEEIILKGAGDKFLHTIEKVSYIQADAKDEYMELVDAFLNESRYYRRYDDRSGLYKLVSPNRSKILLSKLQNSFQILYSATLVLINETNHRASYFDELKLNNFFKPENSNKSKIKDLIQNIGVINTLIELPEKTNPDLDIEDPKGTDDNLVDIKEQTNSSNITNGE